jgi:hypothetical protein
MGAAAAAMDCLNINVPWPRFVVSKTRPDGVVYRMTCVGDAWAFEPVLGEPKRVGRRLAFGFRLDLDRHFEKYLGDQSVLAWPIERRP